MGFDCDDLPEQLGQRSYPHKSRSAHFGDQRIEYEIAL